MYVFRGFGNACCWQTFWQKTLEGIECNVQSHSSYLGISILCMWNHTMCLHCFVLTCKLKWDFDYYSSFLQGLPSRNKSCCNQNLISVCMLEQSSGGTSCGFTNIKRTKICLDPTGNVLQYINIGQISVKMNIFHTNNRKWVLCFSQVGRMGYLACRRGNERKSRIWSITKDMYQCRYGSGCVWCVAELPTISWQKTWLLEEKWDFF